LYAKEPTVEYREQEKRLPVINPLDYLTRGGHSPENKTVNSFATKWRDIVKEAGASFREGQVETTNTSVSRRGIVRTTSPLNSLSNRGNVEAAGDMLELANDLLYQVMAEKNPRLTVPFPLFELMLKNFKIPVLTTEQAIHLDRYNYR